MILLAAVSMCLQDILGVVLVQAEARNRAVLAGLMDSAGWLCAIATTSISVTILQGHSLGAKVTVVLAVSVANFVGTVSGTLIGRRFVKEAK